MASLVCSKCGNLIDLATSVRPPPWCPGCGADLKPGATVSAPGPAAQMPRPQAPPPLLAPPPLMGPSSSRPPGWAPPGTTPNARVYYHPACGKDTVVSGDEFVMLECPFRNVDATFCCSCNDFFALDPVFWTDTGEKISDYRKRLAESAGSARKGWLGSFGNAYQGALNLHLDRTGKPAGMRLQSLDLTAFQPPPEVTALGRPEYVFKSGMGLTGFWTKLEPLFVALNDPTSPLTRRLSRIVGAICVVVGCLAFWGVTLTPPGPGKVIGSVLGSIFVLGGLFLLLVRFQRQILEYAYFDSAMLSEGMYRKRL